MNSSLKKIQDAMLILHQETQALAKNQERIDEILSEMSGTLSNLKQGKVSAEDETPIKKTPKKRKSSRRKKFKKSPEIATPLAPKEKVAHEGNGIKRGKGSRLTDSEKERIKILDKEGMSGRKIADEVGRSQPAVATYIREFLRSTPSP